MKKKRYFSLFLIFILVITSIQGIAIDETFSNKSIEENNKKELASNINKENIEVISEEDNNPSETGNWELGLVFYDSTVNNGKTPLTEINWDASDGGYGYGESRVITVQINYRNTNCTKTYQPGELDISIPNLVYNTYENKDRSSNWSSSVIVGANDNTHIGYDWNFVTGNEPNDKQETYRFQNANIIEAKSNFEGSIQIVYTITPRHETPEQYDDSCEHSYTKDLIATLNNITDSNQINLIYFREYIHPWKRTPYEVTKTANKITSYDGLGANASNYIWVKYEFQHINSFGNSSYPYISAYNGIYKDKIPEECIVYDKNGNLLTPDKDRYYFIEANNNSNVYSYIYVGYPKSIYNEANNNLNITNEVELWGTYNNRTEAEKLAENQISINLNDFLFEYNGDLYGITKNLTSNVLNPFIPKRNMRYQDIVNSYSYNSSLFSINPTAIYTGTPMTIKIGDDLLLATSMDSNYVKLEDDEYYFDKIYFRNPLNGNGISIVLDKYDCELWIRKEGSSEYVLYEEFKNNNKSWTFTDKDKVVSFYFLINDMKESLIGLFNNSDYYYQNYVVSSEVILTKKDIPESGNLYNFGYIQVYFKDDNENLILQNEPGIDSYANLITKDEIANYDLKTYNKYLQRCFGCNNWSFFNVAQPTTKFIASKEFQTVVNEQDKQQIKGTFYIGNYLRPSEKSILEINYKENYDENSAINGFRIYDLLPIGMELDSSEEEIIKSISLKKNGSYGDYYNLNFEELDVWQIKEITDTSVEIQNNWNNTGRTKITIKAVFKEPIFAFGNSPNSTTSFKGLNVSYKINYKVSYDSISEYGKIITNYCYTGQLEKQKTGVYNDSSVKDNGYYDSDAVDLDEDGNMNDTFSYAKAQTTITSVVSTHQDVQKSVKTDKSYYSTGTVESSLDSEYEYKLRARTGQNDVTNLIIYDSLEEYTQNPDGEFVPAYGDKEHWNGEFLGIDTSYAESKGYKVRTYYSENSVAGNLYDEAHNQNPEYMEYTNTTDKSKVKSLAFEYLNADGNPAVIPANSLTYVLIKMKSLNDESITSLAYNGCRTQWQALDEFGKPVDFITGINSNIVKVSLPNTKRGSYLVKHEYYYRDYKGDLILENTVSEEPVHNIPVDTVIKAKDQNHIETNNNKQYIFTQDSGDITIKEDEVQEIILKYVRDEEYGSYQVKHEYYVKEKAETNALAVTFNSNCSGETANYDYLELYYKKDGSTYKLGKYGASSLSRKTINIPSSDFYLYWRTDGSSNQYYGFSIDKIEPIYLEETTIGTTAKLPNYTITELTGNDYPETKHNPYKNGSNLLWHYTGSIGEIIDKYTLENTYSEEPVSNIPVDTVIKANEQNHIETNNNKQYTYTEDSGDITIQKDITKEIIIKYVREEQYTAKLPETGSTEIMRNSIYIILFLLLGSSSLFLATKKRKY